MQSCLTSAPGRLSSKVMPACRSRQRRKLGSPAHSLSLVTVKELVASNSSQLLFDLMKAEVSMAIQHEREARLQLYEDHAHEMDATLQLLSDCAQDREARHAAELRVWHLDRELTERTAAWPKERGTLSMRGVTVELVNHAARHYVLRKKGNDLETYKTILDHIDYQPVVQCFQKDGVYSSKDAYAQELLIIQEALETTGHGMPSGEGTLHVHAASPSGTTSKNAIDIVPHAITEVQCRVRARNGKSLQEVHGQAPSSLGDATNPFSDAPLGTQIGPYTLGLGIKRLTATRLS